MHFSYPPGTREPGLPKGLILLIQSLIMP